MFKPKIGEVYMVKFEGSGHEQQGWRPAIVTQNNIGNNYSPNIIVVPMTSKMDKKEIPTHVFLKADECGLLKDSIALCENPTTCDKTKVGKYITTLSDDYMREIGIAQAIATSTIKFIDIETLIRLVNKVKRMNNRNIIAGVA